MSDSRDAFMEWAKSIGDPQLFTPLCYECYAAGRASRTLGPYTTKMLECAKRWKQHLKLTEDYEQLLDGFINEVEPK